MTTGVARFRAPRRAAQWIGRYDRRQLGGDVGAGLTTAVMLIPQGMAYAMLAGLPPIVGLYASVVPIAAYALIGSSRQLAVGPVAMISLLTLSGASALAQPGSAQFIGFALLLALLVGSIQVAMGILRLGFLVNFLSQPVISGFTSAAALIIGASQLKHILGVELARSANIFSTIAAALRGFEQWHWPSLVLGIAALIILIALKKWKTSIPRALVVVVFGTLTVWGFSLHNQGMDIIGAVPSGFPAPSLPNLHGVAGLLPSAITIALVGFMQSFGVAQAFARRNRYELEANRELLALGSANLAAGLFGGYPVAGGFARTAVNAQAGARSRLASLITAAVVGLTLLFFTPLIYFLPKAVLSAIIVAAVASLLDWREVVRLWRVKRSDLALLAITFAATLGLGIEMGIVVGVGASLLVFIFRTTQPHIAELGRLPGTEEYANVVHHPEAIRPSRVLLLRIDGQLYFGNVAFLKQSMRRFERGLSEPPRAIIIDAASINQLDSSAESALEDLRRDYQERGIHFVMAGVKAPVREVMQRSGLWEKLGASGHVLRVHDAMQALASSQHSST